VNRDDLDAFFAKADDVLDNWRGSDDAMHARVPTDEDAEALPGDSYYEQWDSPYEVALTRAELDMPWPAPPTSFVPLMIEIELDLSAWRHAMDQIQLQMMLFGNAYVPIGGLRGPHPDRIIVDEWVEAERWDAALDPRDRALQMRRNRNTGPKDRRRLDGRATRSGARS